MEVVYPEAPGSGGNNFVSRDSRLEIAGGGGDGVTGCRGSKSAKVIAACNPIGA